MLRAISFVYIVLLFSCSDSSTKNTEQKTTGDKPGIDNAVLSTSLYSILLDYQKKYPLPNDRSGLYVYEARFTRFKKDTILKIWRSSDGYSINQKEIAFGVYEDSILSPTIIRDAKQFYSKPYLKEVVNDSSALEKFHSKPGDSYPESFPPIYNYEVKNETFHLRKVDTVWLKWR